MLFQADVDRLIGKRPFSKPTNYQAYTTDSGRADGKGPIAIEPEDSTEEKAAEQTDVVDGDTPVEEATSVEVASAEEDKKK